MLTSGQAKQYSGAVKEQFPDLIWSFMALIGSRTTIEELSAEHGHRREDHERVRAIDLFVPPPEDGGIWSDLDEDDDPRALSDLLKTNSSEYYGTAFPKWLDHIINNNHVAKNAEELVDWYVTEFGIGKNDHLGHRVGKKFGLIYSAEILAMEHNLLRWEREHILAVVTEMHRNALQTLHSEELLVEKDLAQLRVLAKVHTSAGQVLSGKLKFEEGTAPQVFGKKNSRSRHLYVTRNRMQQLFPTKAAQIAGLLKLEKVGAYRRPVNRTVTQQIEVLVGRKKRKLRYIKLNSDVLLSLNLE